MKKEACQMDGLERLLKTFSGFIDNIVDYIKNLILTIRKFNDENT